MVDKMAYTFTLRDGLLWHDGQPAPAEDCLASLKRWVARDTGGQMMTDSVGSRIATDAKTITLTLAKPFPYVLQLIAKAAPLVPFLMPQQLADALATEAIKEQIGSGPCRYRASRGP